MSLPSQMPTCTLCKKRIFVSEICKYEGLTMHKSCCKCHECGALLDEHNFAIHEGVFFCKLHHTTIGSPRKSSVKTVVGFPAASAASAPSAAENTEKEDVKPHFNPPESDHQRQKETVKKNAVSFPETNNQVFDAAAPHLREYTAAGWLEALSLALPSFVFDPELKMKQEELQAQNVPLGINYKGIFLLLSSWLADDKVRNQPLVQAAFNFGPGPCNMAWLRQNFVLPHTTPSQRLLELAFGYRRRGIPIVAPATDFVSYSWHDGTAGTELNAFGHMLTLWLKNTGDDDDERVTHYLYWDICCQNQHMPPVVSHEIIAATFRSSLRQVQRLIFLCPDFYRPVAAGRVWCQFELMTALSLGINILFAYNRFNSLPDLSFEEFAKTLPRMDAAEASVAADKEFLLRLASVTFEGGLAEVHQRLLQFYKRSFFPSLLTAAIVSGSASTIRSVLADAKEYASELVNMPCDIRTNLYPVHLACQRAHADIVALLVANGAKLDVATFESTGSLTPLGMAWIVNAMELPDFLVFFLCQSRTLTIPPEFVVADGQVQFFPPVVAAHIQAKYDEINKGHPCAAGFVPVFDNPRYLVYEGETIPFRSQVAFKVKTFFAKSLGESFQWDDDDIRHALLRGSIGEVSQTYPQNLREACVLGQDDRDIRMDGFTVATHPKEAIWAMAPFLSKLLPYRLKFEECLHEKETQIFYSQEEGGMGEPVVAGRYAALGWLFCKKENMFGTSDQARFKNAYWTAVSFRAESHNKNSRFSMARELNELQAYFLEGHKFVAGEELSISDGALCARLLIDKTEPENLPSAVAEWYSRIKSEYF
eukprot:m.174653 g.174653  ORF g.174653 m.174653 type:complete len:821 (-) comp21335_c0_seq2:314-2776(-)